MPKNTKPGFIKREAMPMKAVAYCRVSTNKGEQLDSLDSQQNFFTQYCVRNGCELVQIYADEGKSGTKMKNRTQLLKLLSEANKGAFELVLIKDVSRLARNTVDFLTSIRKLKSIGVKVVFVNYDQTSSDSSEFMLTMLSAIAQEESANTSKRVKFGKMLNAEKGRVPNLVFGYDKIPGDYFNLVVNDKEAAIVKKIYDMYIEKNMGANKISTELNKQGIKTKRGCEWSQNSISRILSNQIYTGRIINGKEEVADFLTGKRKAKAHDKRSIVYRPEFRFISDETYEKAQRLSASRISAYTHTGKRNSEKNIFSKMIKCKCCNATYRRHVRQYKNTYIKWVCAGRNAKGATSCPNATAIDENELLNEIKGYFINILTNKPKAALSIAKEFRRQYKEADESTTTQNELEAHLKRAKKSKQKYMDLYISEVITIEELKEATNEQSARIEYLSQELAKRKATSGESSLLQKTLNETFSSIEKTISTAHITNNMLHQIIDTITVDEQSNIEIHLKLIRP